jgi:hypothetical protein
MAIKKVIGIIFLSALLSSCSKTKIDSGVKDNSLETILADINKIIGEEYKPEKVEFTWGSESKDIYIDGMGWILEENSNENNLLKNKNEVVTLLNDYKIGNDQFNQSHVATDNKTLKLSNDTIACLIKFKKLSDKNTLEIFCGDKDTSDATDDVKSDCSLN